MFCKENIDWELFFDQVGQSEQKLLMLDYDGTLAPFRPERSQAKPYSQVRELLEQLAQRPDQRLVLITGRRVHELTSLLALSVQPEVWGCHGLEHLTQDGSYQIQELDEQSLSVLSALDERLESEGLREFLEYKPGAVALHWRGLDQERIRDLHQRTLGICLPICSDKLVLLEFDGGVEFRVPGVNKGDVVTKLLEETNAPCVAAYLGDDFVDEYAFQALRGRGLSVLVRKEKRPSSADIWIRRPEELVEFLSAWVAACGGAA